MMGKLLHLTHRNTLSSDEKGEACSAASAMAASPVGKLCCDGERVSAGSGFSACGVKTSPPSAVGLAVNAGFTRLGRRAGLQ